MFPFISIWLILSIMLPYTWGDLQKAQDDPETIEEAIARLIDVHNDDATSHNEDVQSLGLHRTDETIDHPQSSILPDKFTSRQLWWNFDLHTLDDWEGDTDVFLLSSPGIEVSIPTGGTVVKEINTHPYDAFDIMDWSKHPYFEASVYLNPQTGRLREFNWGGSIGDNVLGFKWDSGTFTCVAIINGTDHSETVTGLTLTGLRNYRAMVDPATGNVQYFVDGVLVKEITGLTLSGADNSGLWLAARRMASVVDSWAIFNLVMARDL